MTLAEAQLAATWVATVGGGILMLGVLSRWLWRQTKASEAVDTILAPPAEARVLAVKVETQHTEVLDRLSEQDVRLDNFDAAVRELVPNGGGSMKDKIDTVHRDLQEHLHTCEMIVLGQMTSGRRLDDIPPGHRRHGDPLP